VGLAREGTTKLKRLFEYGALLGVPWELPARNINAYLADGPAIVLAKRSEPLIPGLPNASKGSQPTDGGYLVVEKEALSGVRSDPIAARYLRLFVQGGDMLHGEDRWCLWLVDAPSSDLRSSPVLHQRLDGVATWRRTQSKTPSVQDAAVTPALFTQIRQPAGGYLAMPEVSSATRRYIPGRFFGPEVIAGNKLIVFPGAQEWLFGLLHSVMWNAWMKAVSGRLKSDIGFSPSIGYFTFPFPDIGDTDKAKLTGATRAVLDARARHSNASLADLYDPLAMPLDLVKAHDELDRIVDSLFAPRKRFRSDAERLAVLFERYELLSSPLAALGATPLRRSRRSSR
jgi:hypothetical protein